MLSSFQNALIVLATVALAAAFLFLLQRSWPSELRRQHNDLIGWHVSVLGSTYAVIIGFMLFAVWTNFELADANAEAEANCVVNLARTSQGLSPPQRRQVLALAKEYVEVMLVKEWPAMNRGELTLASHLVVKHLWTTLTEGGAHAGGETISLDHAFTELSKMTDYRRLRQLQVRADLPSILWFVLILGAILTISAAGLFGSSNFRLHLIQVIMLALMISSALVAIGDINRPFQGSVHVEPAGFERARVTLGDMP